MDNGQLIYEYNMMIIERTVVRSKDMLPAGKHNIEVDTTIAKPGASADVILKVDGNEVGHDTVKALCQRRFLRAKPSMSAWILLCGFARLFRSAPIPLQRKDRKG